MKKKFIPGMIIFLVVFISYAGNSVHAETYAEKMKGTDFLVGSIFEEYEKNDMPMIMDKLVDDGWIYSVLEKEPFFEEVGELDYGITDPFDKKILLLSDMLPDWIEHTLIHETGHATAIYLGDMDLSKEFINIFYKEGQNLTDYGGTNTEEFYAEAFWSVYMYPEETEKNAPLAYEFIKKNIQTMYEIR